MNKTVGKKGSWHTEKDSNVGQYISGNSLVKIWNVLSLIRAVSKSVPTWLLVSHKHTLEKHLAILQYKLHLKQVFRSAYRQELGTKLSQKPWTQESAKTPDWPRRKAVAEFRLCVGHDCSGTHLHRNGICPDPYCILCSLHETTDRNHLRRCTALSSGTECERYWEARTKMVGNWLLPFSVTISVTAPCY